MITVFNSSPLIFLSKLNVIDQSLELFSKVRESLGGKKPINLAINFHKTVLKMA